MSRQHVLRPVLINYSTTTYQSTFFIEYSSTLQEPRGQLSVQEAWPMAIMNAATGSGLIIVSRHFNSVHEEEPMNIMNRYAAARADMGEVAITHSRDDRA